MKQLEAISKIGNTSLRGRNDRSNLVHSFESRDCFTTFAMTGGFWRLLLVILSGILLLTACSDQREVNRAAARKLYEHFNAHDWEAMAGLYAANAEFLDPSLGIEYVAQTQQQIVEKYSGMELMFPDIQDDVKEIYAVDDKVIVQFVATGNSGDSIQLKLPICGILTFKEGKIIRDATYYDN